MNDRDELRANAYLDGEASSAERAAFEADLARDPVLRAEFEELRSIDVALRAETEGERSFGLGVAARTIRVLEATERPMNRSATRLAAALLGALVLGFAVAELFCLRPSTVPPTLPAPVVVPRITSLVGEVLFAGAFQKGGEPVARGMPWKVGDMLTSSNESAVLAEVPGIVEIALGPGSSITRIDDLHYEFSYGHAIVTPVESAPTLSITIPAVATEIFVDEGACELAFGSPTNMKKAGAVLVLVRAIAGPDGSARVRIRDRELRAGDGVLVGDGFFRETGGVDSHDLRWYADLLTSRDR